MTHTQGEHHPMSQGTANITISGNLTNDPRPFGDGGVCRMRIAVNGRRKVDGDWSDHASFFDVVVFGKQAERCSQYLQKGSGVVVSGDLMVLPAREHNGNLYSNVEINANYVQFLTRSGADDADTGDDTGEPVPAGVGATGSFHDDISAHHDHDDIPF